MNLQNSKNISQDITGFDFSFSTEKIIFNHELAMGLSRLDGSHVLQIVNSYTHFSNTSFSLSILTTSMGTVEKMLINVLH